MNKEEFSKLQPQVFQTLDYGLKNQRLSHAYLLTGVKGTPKLTVAKMLAKALVCPHSDPWGCDNCAICKRIDENNYYDYRFIDGEPVDSIKKEEFEDIQDEFSKTGFESSGKKICVINEFNKATIQAQNHLLKFIEEPSGEDVTFILTAPGADSVLPTIVSRTQQLHFVQQPISYYYDLYLKQGHEEWIAYMLSYMTKDENEAQLMSESKEFQVACEAFKTFVECYQRDKDFFLYEFHNKYFSQYKKETSKEDKEETEEEILEEVEEKKKPKEKKKSVVMVSYLVEMINVWLMDSNRALPFQGWYTESINQQVKISDLKAVNEALQSCNNMHNMPYIVDRMIYRMKEE
ncbi:MAG: AAA family ATPase [Erysipelotrichaceae bacterium]|nr:AAA family ATPase [Erysipelotrichaceae bacterium]